MANGHNNDRTTNDVDSRVGDASVDFAQDSAGKGLIVHEWIEPHGGAEKVLDQFAEMFPSAPIYSLWNDDADRYESGRVHESWLARTPLRRHKSLALPFLPATWRAMGKEDADWVLISSHLFAHHVRFRGAARDARKIAYVHTPARYIWEPDLDERGNSPLVRLGGSAFKTLDRRRAAEVDVMIANSGFVRDRIRRTWNQDAQVVYPPVEIDAFTRDRSSELTDAEVTILAELPDSFVLGASRFIPYKRLDIAICAGEAADLPVVLAGDGPHKPALEAIAAEARVPVHFVPRPSTAMLRELYARSLVFVFPPVEDFGIMPVEAMASGTPVIANSVGGASESVQDHVSGILVEDFSSGAALKNAVEEASAMKSEACIERAKEFSTDVFQAKIRSIVYTKLSK